MVKKGMEVAKQAVSEKEKNKASESQNLWVKAQVDVLVSEIQAADQALAFLAIEQVNYFQLDQYQLRQSSLLFYLSWKDFQTCVDEQVQILTLLRALEAFLSTLDNFPFDWLAESVHDRRRNI